jgi:SAM-dependent methyltransferase
MTVLEPKPKTTPHGLPVTPGELARQMDEIYSGTRIDLADIPWNHPDLPVLLTALLEAGIVTPCRALDLGCGAGHYAICLAQRGFSMTGVDISANAIRLAQAHAARLGVSCQFLVGDVLRGLPQLAGGFDFAYDWEVLHHIYPQQRPAYVAAVARLLNPAGLYCSVCFSEHDPQFGGTGQLRTTRLGTVLYFSALGELHELFSPHFTVLDLREVELANPGGIHVVAYALLRKPAATAG